jgi:hypothetical protein
MRLALVLLVAACSSKVKQADQSQAPAPSPPPASSGSGSAAEDSWATKPADPAAEAAAIKADVEIMCGAAKVTGGKVFMDLGPYIAEHMQTSYKMELFKDIRTSTLDEIIGRMRKLMAKANVTQCDTVDVLIANDPRKKQ